MPRLLTACILIVLTAATAAAEQQVLRWMGHWKGEGLREKLVLEALEDFRFLNQDIEVQFAFAADVLPEKSQRDQATFIADMIHSGNITWDVIWLDPSIYNQVSELLGDPLWGEKHLVDFSNVRKIRDAHRSELLQWPDFCEATGGILTGPYIEGFMYCMWYNTETAKRLGLNIPEAEMSVDELLECLRRVDEYNQTADEPVSAFAEFKNSGAFCRLAHNLFLSLNPDSSSKNEIRSAQKKILYTFEQISKLNSVSHKPDRSWQETAQLLSEDRALFLPDSTWRYSTLQKHSGDLVQKLRPAQMPGFKKQEFYCGGFIPVWAVMKNSPAKDTAIRLMEFWCEPEIVDKWAHYTKNPSGLAGSLYDPEYGSDPLSIYQRKLQQKQTLVQDLFMTHDKNHPIYQLCRFIQQIMNDELTAESAFKKLEMQYP